MVDSAGFNARSIGEFRANHGQLGGGFAGAPVLLLHTVGARSGAARVNPMMYLADQGRYLVFASKAGSERNPDWYHNLLAHPEVRIEVGDDVVAVRAVELRGAERDTAYAEQARRHPGFAGYQRKTRRVIPVVALIPTGEGTVPADRTERTSS
ncbi:nitroreductase family deazaflavin-dependent oxidoreductase [Streptomyces sp. RPT161]|uniref:nitroreductase family deazaflavin-dependent oxidoreductase n=1 Tax=Streptomyces sp. RPT161 TaxID=3015993 RepID=UPI0022B89C65|nr:nitroreductase family deazaflavin-dependent oxidoreductase [Streptomyces sp. RPT161]